MDIYQKFYFIWKQYKIKFLDDIYSKQLSTIQLISSPYSKSSSAMVVSSLSRNSLSSSLRYLSEKNLTRDLSEDVVVVNRDGDYKI